MNDKSISVCIPTYEMNGKGVEYLNYSFQILQSQSYKDFDIVISDNSKTDVIKNLCDTWKNKLDIKYFLNTEKYGMSQNTNFSIKKATGQAIKILFQDDFLMDNESLESLAVHFFGNTNYWLVSTSCHTQDGKTFHNPYYPKYHDNIHYGTNSIGSPSVLMFRNENVMEFDENLCWLMDVEYYKRLYERHGLPSICNYITVVNREHENQTSNTMGEKSKNKDIEYIKKKYENL